MNQSDKRKVLLRHYQKYVNDELPKLNPPFIGSQKKTIKKMTECGKAQQIVFKG